MTMIEHQVRERAYYIWEGEGRVCGRAHAHWIQAEAELAAEPETVSAEALPVVEMVARAPKAKATAKPKAPASSKALATGKAAAPKAAAKKTSRKVQSENIALH